MKRFFNGLLIASLAILMTAAVTSCNKKHDTIAKVTVLDANGVPVGGATVRLYGEPSDTIHVQDDVVRDDTLTTDGSGVAVINYNDAYQEGQAGFAVLSIDVWDPNGVYYPNIGIIKVVEEETTETTVQF